MPTSPIRIGPPQIFLSVNSATVVPSVSAVVLGVSSITPTDPLINDVNQALSTTDTYQVMLGLVGRDTTNGGYTVGVTTAAGSNVTISAAGQGIYVRVPNASWPAGFDAAICAALFLKINSAQYQLCQFAYIDPSNDFHHTIIAKPLRVAPRFATGTLTAATSDPILGNRAPLGVTYLELTPTTGDFNFRRPVSQVTVSPNNSPDFQIATGRGSGVSFQALNNEIKTFIQAAAGVYVKFTTYNGGVVTQAHMSLNTAQAIFRENRAIQVFLPPDNNGNQEVRLLIGMLTFNQQELTEAWSKTAPTPVSFTFDPASLDRLITNMHTEIDYLISGT